MKRKGTLIVLLITLGMVLGIGLYYLVSPTDVDVVVEGITEDYDLRSKSVGEDDSGPFIYINLKNREDIPEVEELLEKKLSKKDLKKYRIQVTAIPKER